MRNVQIGGMRYGRKKKGAEKTPGVASLLLPVMEHFPFLKRERFLLCVKNPMSPRNVGSFFYLIYMLADFG